MSKIDISKLPDILTEEGVDKSKQEKILEHIQEILKAEKEEKEENKLPRQKSQLGVILIDELNEIKTNNIAALIYEIPQSSNHDSVMDNLKKAAAEFNNTKKGLKSPVKSVTDAFLTIKPKILKGHSLKKKTKEIVRCLISSNKI
jgi:hypothetical protein